MADSLGVRYVPVGPEVADGCDVVVGGGALAVAARSIAQLRGSGYGYAAFAPVTLPSSRDAPPVLGWLGQQPADGMVDNRSLCRGRAPLERGVGAPLNAQRAAVGLSPVTDVQPYLHPWPVAGR